LSNRLLKIELRLLAVSKEIDEPLPQQHREEDDSRAHDEKASRQLGVSRESLIRLLEEFLDLLQSLEPVENRHIDV